MAELKQVFESGELIVLDVYLGSGKAWDDSEDGLANDFYNLALCHLKDSGNDEPLAAPDYEAEAGINVLMLKEDLPAWEKAGKELGLMLEKREAEAGHYGDGNWSGVDIAQCDDKLYWIEL